MRAPVGRWALIAVACSIAACGSRAPRYGSPAGTAASHAATASRAPGVCGRCRRCRCVRTRRPIRRETPTAAACEALDDGIRYVDSPFLSPTAHSLRLRHGPPEHKRARSSSSSMSAPARGRRSATRLKSFNFGSSAWAPDRIWRGAYPRRSARWTPRCPSLHRCSGHGCVLPIAAARSSAVAGRYALLRVHRVLAKTEPPGSTRSIQRRWA